PLAAYPFHDKHSHPTSHGLGLGVCGEHLFGPNTAGWLQSSPCLHSGMGRFLAVRGMELFRQMQSPVECWPASPPNIEAKQPPCRAAPAPVVLFPVARYQQSFREANSLAVYA